MIIAPCKECRASTPDKHYLGCHDHCDEFQEYRKKQRNFKDQFRKDYSNTWTVSSEKKKAKWAKERM